MTWAEERAANRARALGGREDRPPPPPRPEFTAAAMQADWQARYDAEHPLVGHGQHGGPGGEGHDVSWQPRASDGRWVAAPDEWIEGREAHHKHSHRRRRTGPKAAPPPR